jgi:hypothetical protein
MTGKPKSRAIRNCSRKNILARHIARLEEVDIDRRPQQKAGIVERLAHCIAQAPDVLLERIADPQRMQAERIREAIPVRDPTCLGAVVDMAGRYHEHRHTGSACPRHHRVTIGVELVCVQVAVRVDPHRT